MFLLKKTLIYSLLLSSIIAITGCESVRSLRYENQALEQRVFQYKQDYTALGAELQQVQNDRDSKARDIERLESEVSTLGQQLQSVLDKMTDSQKQQTAQMIENVESRMERENELKLELERVQSRLESTENDKALAESRVTELESSVTTLEAEMEALKANLNALGENSEILLTERDAARAERDDFRRQLKTTESSKDEVAAEVADLSEKLRDMEKESTAIKQKLGQAESEVTELKNQVTASKANREAIFSGLESSLAPLASAGRLTLANSDQPTISILTDDLYQPGTVLLSSDGKEIIDAIGDAIGSLGGYSEVLIEGHTDSVPVKNMPFIDNWDLAAARAATVTRTLSSRSDIPSKKLRATSHAFFSPIGSNESADGRKNNRRVEIKIISE